MSWNECDWNEFNLFVSYIHSCPIFIPPNSLCECDTIDWWSSELSVLSRYSIRIAVQEPYERTRQSSQVIRSHDIMCIRTVLHIHHPSTIYFFRGKIIYHIYYTFFFIIFSVIILYVLWLHVVLCCDAGAGEEGKSLFRETKRNYTIDCCYWIIYCKAIGFINDILIYFTYCLPLHIECMHSDCITIHYTKLINTRMYSFAVTLANTRSQEWKLKSQRATQHFISLVIFKFSSRKPIEYKLCETMRTSQPVFVQLLLPKSENSFNFNSSMSAKKRESLEE